MVEKELIYPSIEEVRNAITSARMERRESGAWILIVTVTGVISIDENRSAAFAGEPRISGRQQGQRSRGPRRMNKAGKFAKTRKAK